MESFDLRGSFPFISDKPLEFDFDPDTGLVSLVFYSGWDHPTKGQIETKHCLLLAPAASQALLADLPKLEALLLKAAKGPTKPRFVQ